MNLKQPEQPQPQQSLRRYETPGYIYDEINDELIDLDNETQESYDRPYTVPGPAESQPYQHLDIPDYLKLENDDRKKT